MPKTRTKSGKQVLSISITDADRALLERLCGPKEFGAFLGRLLRAWSQERLGENTLANRLERIETHLLDLLGREKSTIGK